MFKNKTKKLKPTEKVVDSNLFKNGCIDTIDMILPDGYIENVDYSYLGVNNYVRSYGIKMFPQFMYVGFFNDILALGDVTISSYIENIPDGEIISQLTDKYAKLRSNVSMKEARGDVVDHAELEAVEDLDSLRKIIQTNKDRMFYTQVIINVHASSLKELDNKCELISDTCARKGIKPQVAVEMQKEAYITSLPLLKSEYIKNLKNMTTGAIACLIPVGNTGLFHRGGIYYGQMLNRTHSSVVYNTFAGPPFVTNPHVLIAGIAGGGKSVTEKLIVMRGAANGEYSIILDPEGEYEDTVNMLGGQYIILKPGVKSGINPMDLEIADDGAGRNIVDLYSKKAEIRELISVFLEKFRGNGLQGVEIIIVDEAVGELYTEREINIDSNSLFQEVKEEIDGNFHIGKVKKLMPTLSDLREKLIKDERTSEVAELMKLITGDGSLAMFDCQSTINLGNRVIGINFKNIADEFSKFFATVNTLSWIWTKFSNWKLKDLLKRVIVDEGWIFTKYKASVSFLEQIARRGRKYKISLVIASQMLNEFLGSDSGKAIIHQCATKIIMKQDPSIANEVAQFFRLSDSCIDYLSSFDPGQALLLNEQETVKMQFNVFDFELAYVRT